MSVEQRFLEGVALHQSGQLDQAERVYQAILDENPSHADALHYVGLIAFQRGKYREATSLIKRAIECSRLSGREVPAEYQINLGNALKRINDVAEAISAYQVATVLRPNMSIAWYNLGLVQRAVGDKVAAVASLETACRSLPTVPLAWLELGECYAERGDGSAALHCFKNLFSGLVVAPANVAQLQIACRIGKALVSVALYDAAVAILDPLSRSTSDLEFLNILGCALAGLGRTGDAERCLARAHTLAPNDCRITDNLACVLKDSGRVHKALQLYEDLFSSPRSDQVAWSNYLFTLLYSDKHSPEQVLAEHRRFVASVGLSEVPDTSIFASRTYSTPLRVAYLSGDLRNHPVAYFLLAILPHHNPNRVSVTVYDNSAVSDCWTDRLKENADRWVKVRSMSDQELAQQICADRIDVLIELSGHTADNRLAALATHPAIVQVSYLGYPFSTGLPWIDWRIVDSISDPHGSEISSTERLYRFHRSYYTYSSPLGAPDVTQLPAKKNGYLTFGVCSNLAKVSETTLDLWAQLLKHQSGTRLYWRAKAFSDPEVKERMIKSLANRGVDRKRLQLHPWASHADRWNAFQKFDVALDTFPYNQATNTCEGLWMGIPTLSVAGQGHQSRMGASILAEVGLTDWVLDIAEYQGDPSLFFKRAASLLDVETISQLRCVLRKRMLASRLMDGKRAAAEMEDACMKMLKMRIDG